ncbi:hypothetical protein BDQ17DRAFT_1428916 [Cyathus striatus]|nr:hypothetical protein BDQ17DRAFT_1428916 [Cyathus striatus]
MTHGHTYVVASVIHTRPTPQIHLCRAKTRTEMQVCPNSPPRVRPEFILNGSQPPLPNIRTSHRLDSSLLSPRPHCNNQDTLSWGIFSLFDSTTASLHFVPLDLTSQLQRLDTSLAHMGTFEGDAVDSRVVMGISGLDRYISPPSTQSAERYLNVGVNVVLRPPPGNLATNHAIASISRIAESSATLGACVGCDYVNLRDDGEL